MDTAIEYTSTIQSVLGDFSGSNPVHAVEVVKKILSKHKDYASGTAREVAGCGSRKFMQHSGGSSDAVPQLPGTR